MCISLLTSSNHHHSTQDTHAYFFDIDANYLFITMSNKYLCYMKGRLVRQVKQEKQILRSTKKNNEMHRNSDNNFQEIVICAKCYKNPQKWYKNAQKLLRN